MTVRYPSHMARWGILSGTFFVLGLLSIAFFQPDDMLGAILFWGAVSLGGSLSYVFAVWYSDNMYRFLTK